MTSRNLQNAAMGAVIPVVSPHISQNSQAPTLPLQSSSKQFATTEFIDTMFANTSTIATGTSIQSYQQTAPTGFLAKDGSEISRTTYANLFAKIGTSYGAGDGSTTFNLPDDIMSIDVEEVGQDLNVAPVGKHNPTISYYNGCLYVLGGWNLSYTQTSEFWKFNLTTGIWTQLTSFNVTIGYHTAVVYNNQLIIIGGMYNENRFSNSISIYNLDTNVWSYTAASCPVALLNHSSVIYGSKVYCLSATSNNTSPNNICYMYDILANSWTVKTSCPQLLNCTSANLIGTNIYVCGGTTTVLSSNGAVNTTMVYDILTDSWTYGQMLPSPINDHSSGTVGKNFIYCAGQNASGGFDYDIMMYNTVKNQIYKVGCLPIQLSAASACIVNNIYYLYSGYSVNPGSGNTQKIYKLTIGKYNYIKY